MSERTAPLAPHRPGLAVFREAAGWRIGRLVDPAALQTICFMPDPNSGVPLTAEQRLLAGLD